MILEKIAASTRIRVEKAKKKNSLAKMKQLAFDRNTEVQFPFEKTLEKEGIHFICEVKKASPSKGIIAENFPYLEIALEYEQAGAAAISCLTEPAYFLGKDQYLKEIADNVQIPVLRKDFIIDEYQIYEAKALGADIVLLICTLLDPKTLKEYITICDSLGLSALVEAHDEEELSTALLAGARIVGVNNRNLKDFTVDLQNSIRLRALAPDHVFFIAESGIRSAADVNKLRSAKVNGVLIGETLMRSENKKEMLEQLRKTYD